MKNYLRYLFSGMLVVGLCSNSFAEVPTKPSYSKTVKAMAEKEKSNKVDVASEENSSKEHSRAMLEEKSEAPKKSNVLKSIKSGRLAETNKKLID